jgi:hypothetical protein
MGWNTASLVNLAAKLIDDLGVAFGVKQIDGKPRVSSTPYLYDIAEGNVTGHAPFKLPAKTDIRVSAIASATGIISTMMIGWIETA